MLPVQVTQRLRKSVATLPHAQRVLGQTGVAFDRTDIAESSFYPLVDAAMGQLNSTGYMHHRLRKVAASFLVKNLHVDWRCGERYFASKLNNFDLAANNGGWQWPSSTGCDAQPYFRVFNPVMQSRRFDGDGRFIRMYIPELAKVNSDVIHEPGRRAWRSSGPPP